MKIQYNVQAPPKKPAFGRAKSEEVKAIVDFLTSGNAKNMCFQYDSTTEAKRKTSTIASHRKRWQKQHPNKGYETYRVGAVIYIVRAGKSK